MERLARGCVMHFLFVKQSLSWPRSSGHDVHSYHMMAALVDLGHQVSLATAVPPGEEALMGLELEHLGSWLPEKDGPAVEIRLTRLQERFRSYWGVDEASIQAVGQQAWQYDVDAVVVVGLEVLPLLAGVQDACRIWYAADEWVWHHLSLVRPAELKTWNQVRAAAVKGLYERAYRGQMDRAWVVSQGDRRAMRHIAGVRNVDLIPNGVDTEHYRPLDVPEIEHSCVFWGRLDFEPNIDALLWFCRHVWPDLKRTVPQARLQVYGFNPVPEVEALASIDGVKLTFNLPDLRCEIAQHQVVVLPFQSGGGIKNKLLEAAAMARPIVCSPRACNGLRGGRNAPLVLAGPPRAWIGAIADLWKDSARRRMQGAAAREWVMEHHTWRSVAATVAEAIELEHAVSVHA